MDIIKEDWRAYLDRTGGKADYVIVDPPWNYKNVPPKLQTQLDYTLWEDNEMCLSELIQRIDAKCILVWVTNGMLPALFNAVDKQSRYKYKVLSTWVKQTTKGNLFYGLGYWFRNATEHLALLTDSTAKPFRSRLRNVFLSVPGKRTTKPRSAEVDIVKDLSTKGYSKGTYLFSGLENLDVFEPYDIDLVDLAHGKG